jgi:hypothetical protein
MGEQTSNKNKGCLKPILALIGFIILLSPLNPFIEYKNIGEDKFLTNSSWLVMVALIFGYLFIVFKWIKD